MEENEFDYSGTLSQMITEDTIKIAKEKGISINKLVEKLVAKDDVSVFIVSDENGNEVEEPPKETLKRELKFMILDNIVNRYCNMFKSEYKQEVSRDANQEFVSNQQELRENGNFEEYLDNMINEKLLAIQLNSGKIVTQPIPEQKLGIFKTVCTRVINDIEQSLDMSEMQTKDNTKTEIKSSEDKKDANESKKVNEVKETKEAKSAKDEKGKKADLENKKQKANDFISKRAKYSGKELKVAKSLFPSINKNSKVLKINAGIPLDEAFKVVELYKENYSSDVVLSFDNKLINIAEYKSLDEAKLDTQKVMKGLGTSQKIVSVDEKINGSNVAFVADLSQSSKNDVQEAVNRGASIPQKQVIDEKVASGIIKEGENIKKAQELTEEINENKNDKKAKIAVIQTEAAVINNFDSDEFTIEDKKDDNIQDTQTLEQTEEDKKMAGLKKVADETVKNPNSIEKVANDMIETMKDKQNVKNNNDQLQNEENDFESR